MKHFRPDYNRIQDPANLIPTDEPVFILRGQDKHAAQTLRYYAYQVFADDGDLNIVKAVLDGAKLVDAWPKKKAPDMPAVKDD